MSKQDQIKEFRKLIKTFPKETRKRVSWNAVEQWLSKALDIAEQRGRKEVIEEMKTILNKSKIYHHHPMTNCCHCKIEDFLQRLDKL